MTVFCFVIFGKNEIDKNIYYSVKLQIAKKKIQVFIHMFRTATESCPYLRGALLEFSLGRTVSP